MIGRNPKKGSPRREVRCYLCGGAVDVSARTMSTTCPNCHKAIKIENVVIKSYTPVNDLLTCGSIEVTKRGRVAAKRVHSGQAVKCDGVIEGKIECRGSVVLGPKSSWKGDELATSTLTVKEGAKINGILNVPSPEMISENAESGGL